MSDLNKSHEAQKREMPEPSEGNGPVPWLVRGVIVGLFIWSAWYIWFMYNDIPPAFGDLRTAADFRVDKATASASGDASAAVNGGKLYATHCTACHQANGDGIAGVFPPLGGSEWVQGEPEVLLQILLHGIHGELIVDGVVYNGDMPPFGHTFDDAELAAVATFIRTDFGNDASEVTEEQAAEQRAAVDRSEPWDGQEELETFMK